MNEDVSKWHCYGGEPFSSGTSKPKSEAHVMENRHIITASMNISHALGYHIVHDTLQFHEVSARWVPRQLTGELKK